MQVCSDSKEWNEYVLEAGGHPLQLWQWGRVKELHGWRVERYVLRDEGRIVAGTQVLRKPLPFPFGTFAYVPRGPIADTPELRDELLSQVARYVKRRYRALALSIEPDVAEITLPAPWRQATNSILPKETILLDITNDDSELLAAMAKKTRQYIRKSQAEVKIRPAKGQDDLDACLALYKETAERAGFARHSRSYYEDVFHELGDHSPIFIAEEDGVPVAFLWLAISASTAYELYGGVSARGQELRANYALKWYAIRKMKEWGLERYDFGGLVAGGVTTFKQAWATEVTSLAGTFDFPLSPLYSVWAKGLPFAKKLYRLLKRS